MWGFLPAPLSLTRSEIGRRPLTCPPLPARGYLGPAGCAAICAAVGAPLGEWRAGTLPGSPSRATGLAALAPPGWAQWDTGRQLATQGGGPWSPRAPHLNRTGPTVTVGAGPAETEAGHARGESKWYLSNSSPPATLALGTAPVISCARRVGSHPPRPCLAKRAYRTGRGPFPSPLTGRFSTGAQACSYLLQKSPCAADPARSCCAPCE